MWDQNNWQNHQYQSQLQNQTMQQLAQPWPFLGNALYDAEHKGYIKVDKGTPDKAKFVIFYAVEKKDPMIFCNSKSEVMKELSKLSKRREVDMASVRVFGFMGGVKVKKTVTIQLKSGRKVKGILIEEEK